MSLPNNRTDFKTYCLRNLGDDITDIEISDEQVEDRIDEALALWQKYHYDGTERIYLKHLITDADKVNQYIDLSPLIIGVVNILDLGIGGSASSLFNVRYQLALNDLWDLSSTSLIPYVMARTHISLFQHYFSQQPHIRFNMKSHRLYLDADWTQILSGQYMIVEVFRILDPDSAPDLWNDDWLRSYATALIKRNWGANLKKYSNVVLLGGVQVDGQKIYDEAVNEIATLRQELLDNYMAPPFIFIG